MKRSLLFLVLLSVACSKPVDAPPRLEALDAESMQKCLGYPAALTSRAPHAASDLPWPKAIAEVDFEARFEGKLAIRSAQQEFFVMVLRPGEHFTLGVPESPDARPATFSMGSRTVAQHGLSMMMGGALEWVEVPSPHGTYTLVLVFDVGHSDSVQPGDTLAAAGHERVRALTDAAAMAPALACIDARLW